MVSTSPSTSTPGLPRKPVSNACPFSDAEHRARGLVTDRSKPHRGIAQQFDHDAAQARRDQRSELTVVLDAEHDLDAGGRHLLHADAVDPGLRRIAGRPMPGCSAPPRGRLSGVDRPSLTPPASVLCRISGDTILIATGPPIWPAASAACSRIARHDLLRDRDAIAGEYSLRIRLRQRRAAACGLGEDGARRLLGRRRRSPRRLRLPVGPTLVPVEPRPQGRKAAIGRTKHADPWIGIEKFAARSLIPFVHPDHRQRPIGAGRGLDNRRRPRAARGGVREDHRHHQRAEAGIVHEGIEAKSETFPRSSALRR